ncbi:ATP synthase F0F1 subunit B' [Rhizobium sp. Leaf371]|uniref:F0F1 ATP synthase subunit B n=1 Tax=unclassified Rhizobium TaxID=2613769 RepID=UPI000715BC9D|nr:MULTISPECIES: F0F1 ATP synthase subunit B [unclassified Rhizobium]KQS67769.1 ATP synthase F0F1 subunit B' [Rhizobium sp. Leaf371]TCM55846.1 F-type H+-transporting ATPase subunit b [Rhizobium sp. PP-F2F-G48]
MFVTAAYAQSTTPPEGETPHAAPGDVHTETGVASEGGHGSGVFPPFDQSTFASQLVWLAITFGLFYLLMQKVIMPRIATILATRHDAIARDLDAAARSKAEADAAIASYEQELAAARAKGNAIAASAREAAKVKAAADRAAVEAALNDKIAAAESRIAEIKASALADVGAIAEETASAVVEQLLGREVPRTEIASAVKAAAE